jgi:hypothetical protein
MEYEALVRETVPRSEALSRELASRVDPAWGFVFYGILWFFVSWGPPGIVLALGLRVAGKSPAGWFVMFVLVAWAISYIAMWWLFARWVRRRRAAARVLFRDGSFANATVVAVTRVSSRAGRATLATPMHEVKLSVSGHPSTLSPGVTMPVLWVPHYRYCAAFLEGILTVAKIS